MSQEAAQWSLLIGKLDDIASLSAILSSSKIAVSNDDKRCALPILPYAKPDVSLMAIVNGGKGIVTELVAKWLNSSSIDPRQICEVEMNASTQSIEVEPKSVLYYLNMLREHFPFSLSSGVLLSQMTWEYMCVWSKNMSNFNYLTAALSCLSAFKQSDYSIKHGLCCMVWNAHLKIPLEATKKLINKAGRLPKERLCLQDIGLSDFLVSELLEHSQTFLNHFSSSAKHEKQPIRFEELLQEGPIPLSSLAVQQNVCNNDLLALHKQLNQVLFIIASLNIKYSKPIQTLFDGLANQSFFCEINRQLPYSLPPPDLLLSKKRIEFLCLAITSTMDSIREDFEQVFLDDHNLWMERIDGLAAVWGLDSNDLKKHQVSDLAILALTKISSVTSFRWVNCTHMDGTTMPPSNWRAS